MRLPYNLYSLLKRQREGFIKLIMLYRLAIFLASLSSSFMLVVFNRTAREALLHASMSLRVETLFGILFLLMAKCRGNGREPLQRMQRYCSTLW